MDTRFLEEEKDALMEKRAFLDDFVLPDYDTFNVRNIKSLIGKIFGVNSLVTAALPNGVVDDFRGVEKVFLVVMDGFGYNRLLSHVRNHDDTLSDLIRNGVLKPFTSPFPATTSTSLASIFTGLTPAEHGILGYQMFSHDYGCVVNTLDMKPVYGYSSEVEIARDLSRKVKPWMPVLQTHGVRTLIATKGSIMGSGLSRVIHADQDVAPYMLESEMMVKCRKALENQGPAFLVLYYSGVDTLEHKYGPSSEEVTSEIQSFEFLLKNLFSRLSDNTQRETLIMLTSDHGVCETKRTVYIKDYPEVANMLQLPPVGDSRAAFLFAKQGENENLKKAFEKNLDGFRLVASDELIDVGAFGKRKDTTLIQSALGNYAALSKGPNGLSYPYYEDDRNSEQRGGHGGMTPEEVIVPLLSMRLSKAQA
jgi:predicted AlkP superfamily pyrophosphatase or phosphodiesterase